MRRKIIPLYARKKRGGVAPAVIPIVTTAVTAGAPLAKKLLIKSLPHAKKAAAKAIPYLVPMVGKKIRKKIGLKKKQTKGIEKMAQATIINQLNRSNKYLRRKATQALINSL